MGIDSNLGLIFGYFCFLFTLVPHSHDVEVLTYIPMRIDQVLFFMTAFTLDPLLTASAVLYRILILFLLRCIQ